jgi:hypothetical protein
LQTDPLESSLVGALQQINVAINNVRWVMKAGAVVVEKTKPQPH